MAEVPKINPSSLKKNNGKEGEFCTILLSAAVQFHILHLTVTPNALAKHLALNTLYDELPGLVDSLAESIQGKLGILNYDGQAIYNSKADIMTFVESTLKYVETTRKEIIQDSYVQNQIDSIVQLLYSTIYKLKNL